MLRLAKGLGLRSVYRIALTFSPGHSQNFFVANFTRSCESCVMCSGVVRRRHRCRYRSPRCCLLLPAVVVVVAAMAIVGLVAE